MAAGLGFKTFTTGEVLTAGDVNGYLMQGINVFANATARDAAITSPQEGQFAYTKDNNSLWYYSGSAWVASGATGDIEGVTATSPLTGGGTSGTVTVGIQDASTSQRGSVQLSDSTSTTSSVLAATPTAVKSAYDLAAAAIPKSTVTTNGDLIYGTGSATVTRRAIGTTGQVLTVSGGVPTWATPSSGGMDVLATGTLSGSSITISSISQSYKNLQLVLEKCLPAGAGEGPIIRFNGDTGTNYYRTTSTVVNLVTWNETQLRLGGIQDNTTSQSLAVCTILDYANTTTWKMAQNITIQNRNGTPTSFDINNTQALFWAASGGTSAITSIEIKTDTSAGFTSGTYILYGVK
jgi:hypothetical protein